MMMCKEIINRVQEQGRNLLTEVESKALLKLSGISVVDTKLAKSREEAISLGKQLGFPLVMKIVCSNILHKSDVGGVRLGLKTTKQVAQAYDDIMRAVKQERPDAAIEGISVERMVRPGVEVIIGMSRDVHFGPVLMFGLGGILVEILKDVSFRIVPLTRKDAVSMIREIKGYPLLEGYRGQEVVDISKLEDMLLMVSDFAEHHPEIKEIDLNPVFAYADGATTVDARIILSLNTKWDSSTTII